MDPSGVETIGEQPRLAGCVLDALVVEEYWHAGALDIPANVIWLRVDAKWHRLCIDCGVVFWRRDDLGPKPYDKPDSYGSVRLTDLGQSLGLAGEAIASIEARSIHPRVEVIVRFASGKVIGFRDADDRTTYYTG